jgi:hypothetical protein
MKVSEYVDYVINGDCAKLSISDVGDMSLNPTVSPTLAQAANQLKFINFVNLANLALHKKFHLLKKTIEFDSPSDEEEFTLPPDYLVSVEAYYASDFDPVSIKDTSVKVVGGVDTAVSILIPEPFKAVIKGTDSEARTPIMFKYAAAPRKAVSTSTDIKISEVYTEALLHYISYKAYGTISGDIKDENNTYFLRYREACLQITASGMDPNNHIDENTKLIDNGFV